MVGGPINVLKGGTLLRFTLLGTPETPTTAHFIDRLVRVLLPDAVTGIDLTPGAGCFFSEVVPTSLQVTASPHDCRHLPYADTSFDVPFLDPPHLGDLGENSIMRARYGTLRGDQVKGLIQDGAAEAWRIARIGLVVKVTEHCHGQRFQAESSWVEGILGEPYERLHLVRKNCAGARSDPQLSAYSNGATFLVYRRGDQRRVRRTRERPPVPARVGAVNQPTANPKGGPTPMDRQHVEYTPSKQVRRSGGPQPCDHCGSDTTPPDVRRSGSTSTRYLHPACSERDGAGEIVDAAAARQLQYEQGRRDGLRVLP